MGDFKWVAVNEGWGGLPEYALLRYKAFPTWVTLHGCSFTCTCCRLCFHGRPVKGPDNFSCSSFRLSLHGQSIKGACTFPATLVGFAHTTRTNTCEEPSRHVLEAKAEFCYHSS